MCLTNSENVNVAHQLRHHCLCLLKTCYPMMVETTQLSHTAEQKTQKYLCTKYRFLAWLQVCFGLC